MSLILVDTSAWVEHLRDGDQRIADLIDRCIESNRLATTDIIRMEVLAGARTPRVSRRLDAALSRCRHFPVRPLFEYEAAATLYRQCRARGVTPRQLTDCLIAAVAIRNDVPVLSADRDFEAIASVTDLRLA